MVAHHFVVERIGGLRTYDHVLEYIANPVIFVIESLFLVVVTIHAMLGLRSVLFDFGIGERSAAARQQGPGRARRRSPWPTGSSLIGVLASRA